MLNVCETLSGQKAEVSFIPLFSLGLIKTLAGFSKWSWSVRDRLAFAEVFLDLLSEDHYLIRSKLAKKDFEEDLIQKNSKTSHFWFRMFSYLLFSRHFFEN